MIKKIGLIIAILFFVKNVNAQTTSIKDSIKLKSDTIEASYPGGLEGFKKFLQKTLNANVTSDNGSPSGIYSTIISFNVDTNGVLYNIKPETNLGYGTEAEGVRVLKKSGNWIPASVKGKLIKSIYRQPISFEVIDDDTEYETKNSSFTIIAGEINYITIRIPKTKNSSFIVTISNGSIVEKENGSYNVLVEKSGRVLIKIHSRKNNKLLSSAYFNVIEQKK